jgi:hypothetical protein
VLYGTQASLSPGDFGSWIAPSFGDIERSSSDIADISEGEPKEQNTKDGLFLQVFFRKYEINTQPLTHFQSIGFKELP